MVADVIGQRESGIAHVLKQLPVEHGQLVVEQFHLMSLLLMVLIVKEAQCKHGIERHDRKEQLAAERKRPTDHFTVVSKQ